MSQTTTPSGADVLESLKTIAHEASQYRAALVADLGDRGLSMSRRAAESDAAIAAVAALIAREAALVAEWDALSMKLTGATVLVDAWQARAEEAEQERDALAVKKKALRASLKVMCNEFECRMDDWENAEFHDEYNDAIALLASTSDEGEAS